MARLVGVDSPARSGWRSRSRTSSGIGRTRALESCAQVGIDPNKRAKDLTDEELVKLRDWIEATYKVEGDLRREVTADIRRKIEIGCYQGIRHRAGCRYGVSGRTNARGRKGPRRTVAGKKKAGKK
jgi:Ribosomal protein S13